MGSLAKRYDFEPYEDLTGKARGFIDLFGKLGTLAHEMQLAAEKELAGSSGEMVDSMNEELKKELSQLQIHITQSVKVMHDKAVLYSGLMNDMKTQNITIYYEESAMPPNGKQGSGESRHSNTR
ncbi:hypothetical protein ACFVHQ_02665 [Actinomycetes bacterium NPDC127524]